MSLNRILGSFTKTITKLEKFIAQADKNIETLSGKAKHEQEEFESKMAYFDHEITSNKSEREIAVSVKTKIEGLIN